MSTDLVIGTFLGFGISVIFTLVIAWLDQRKYDKMLEDYNTQNRYYTRLLPSAKKKKNHLKIVKDKKDD